MIKEKATNKETIFIYSDRIYHILYKSISIAGANIEIHLCSEAFDIIKDRNASLILLDCGFNTAFGLKLLKIIKLIYPTTPVIFLTSESSEELAISAFRAGARDYIKKPFNIFKLQIQINELLRIKRTSKEKRVQFLPDRIKMIEEFKKLVTSEKPINLLNTIIYIEDHLSEDLSLEICAKTAGLSKYHFSRVFKKYIGTSPMQFVKLKRIERAKKLLKEDHLNITEVAYTVGFHNQSHLIGAFKENTGMTPTEFRKTLKVE